VIADFLRFNRGRSGDPREHPPPLLILDANARDGGEQGSPSLWVPRGALMTSLELVIAEPDLQDVGADHRSGW
jgi:hypothetical protein